MTELRASLQAEPGKASVRLLFADDAATSYGNVLQLKASLTGGYSTA